MKNGYKDIPCGSVKTFDGESYDYDCKYEHGDDCENCICVLFGDINPITGKRLNKISRHFKLKRDIKEYEKQHGK